MMLRKAFHLSFYCKFPAVVLAFCWTCGLIAGASYSLATIEFVSLLMRMMPYSHMSIVGLVVNLFPVLIIYFAANRLISNSFIYLTVLFKGFIFSFCFVSMYLFYGSAGWLIFLFASFKEIFTIVPFLWFSLRSISGYNHTIARDTLIYLLIYIAVSVIDIFCISPYFVYIMLFS